MDVIDPQSCKDFRVGRRWHALCRTKSTAYMQDHSA